MGGTATCARSSASTASIASRFKNIAAENNEANQKFHHVATEFGECGEPIGVAVERDGENG